MHIVNCIIISDATKKLILVAVLYFFSISFSFSQTSDSAYSYTSIHYKGSAKIQIDGQTYNGQFYLVNEIDSLLYIQLNMGAIEVGRAFTTPDKFLFINKLQQNYYEGDYSFFQHLIGLEIDFYAIQAIFNGLPVAVSEDIELSYQGKTKYDEYSFFDVLLCKTEGYALKLEVKKVTFNEVPKVSATVPKNYSAMNF